MISFFLGAVVRCRAHRRLYAPQQKIIVEKLRERTTGIIKEDQHRNSQTVRTGRMHTQVINPFGESSLGESHSTI